MKRFTETEKWKDKWFRALTPAQKCLWVYLCDNCDHAGVIEPDFGLASFQIGVRVSERDMDALGDRVRLMDNGKYWIRAFVRFQYGKLSEACKPHAPVFAAISRHGLTLEEIEQNSKFRESVTPALRAKIIARDGLTCAYYGTELTEVDVEIDHIVPKAKGGTNDPQNLVVASRRANSEKGELDLGAFCEMAKLDEKVVYQRLFERVSKPLRECPKGFQSLQEKEKEKEKEEEDGASVARVLPPTVEAIYAAYPRKVAKQDALKAIAKALQIVPADTLLEAVSAYAAATAEWPDADKEYIPHPSTWFNGGRYNDDRTTWKRGSSRTDPILTFVSA